MSIISYTHRICAFLVSLLAIPSNKHEPPRTRQVPLIDLVVFSYDRPMQLSAFLESAERSIKGVTNTFVIYRASSWAYEQGYSTVKEEFPSIIFIKQSSAAKQDFKPLVLDCVFKLPHPYILFAVDDIIVKDSIDLQECASVLEDHTGYGFFLSLGKNLTYCYTMDRPQKLPPLQQEKEICTWYFKQGEYDWNYPHSLDMTLYRKSDLEYFLHFLEYTSPNTLEYELAIRADMNRIGVCYESSKVLNIPLNIVQTDFENIHTNSFTTEYLLNIFNAGLKIDIQPFYRYNNKARHIDTAHLIRFIEKKDKKGT